MDTASPQGRFTLQILGAMAEFERGVAQIIANLRIRRIRFRKIDQKSPYLQPSWNQTRCNKSVRQQSGLHPFERALIRERTTWNTLLILPS